MDVEPWGRVRSANCEYATVEWLKMTSDKGGGDPDNSWSWPITGDFVYPASALAAEQAKVRELVEVLQMMVFMVKREAPILAGKAVGHADAIIAKYGEQK